MGILTRVRGVRGSRGKRPDRRLQPHGPDTAETPRGDWNAFGSWTFKKVQAEQLKVPAELQEQKQMESVKEAAS